MMAYYEIQGGIPSADLLRKLADALGVSTDMLLGRASEPHRAAPPTSNLRLLKRLMRVEELPSHDRKMILKLIDTMANEVRRRKAS